MASRSHRIFSTFRRSFSSRQFTPYIWSRQFLHDATYLPWSFLTWLPAAFFFKDHVGGLMRVNGPSMSPFLNTHYDEDLIGDLCWVTRWNPTANLRRGMIVSYWSPNRPEAMAVKRVIALEGDIVSTRAPCPLPTVTVPRGHVWVEGDNKDLTKTLDSNHYGPIPLNLIDGKVTRVIWPFRSAGPVQWREFKGRTRVIRGRRENAPGWD